MTIGRLGPTSVKVCSAPEVSSDWNAMAAPEKMHAMVRREYGQPNLLTYEEIERPVPGDEDVLVRVHAAIASIGDYLIVTGRPYLIRFTPFGGFPKPRNRVPGACMAGRVETVGAKVTTCRPGDEVFGEAVTGAFAEYVMVPAKLIAPKPSNLSFDEAATVPWAVAPLQGLRDVGALKAGQSVLINGASGGVGSWAVQIAKTLGAHVTAVCSTRNVEMVRGLGADEVIDYTKKDFIDGGARFDVVFDAVGNRSLSDCRSVLMPEGIYVQCSGGDSGSVDARAGEDASRGVVHAPEAQILDDHSKPRRPVGAEGARRDWTVEAGD